MVPAEEARLLFEARDVLESARLQAAQILADAREEAQRIRFQAVAAARTQADALLAQALQDAERRRAEALARESAELARKVVGAEERTAALVIRVLGKLLGERQGEERFFSGVIQRVLGTVREEKYLLLRVAPEQLDSAQRAVDEALASRGAAPFVSVTADPRLRRGDCRVETEFGVLDAGLDTQLQAIRSALEQVWRPIDAR